jgi:hypothetical protein
VQNVALLGDAWGSEERATVSEEPTVALPALPLRVPGASSAGTVPHAEIAEPERSTAPAASSITGDGDLPPFLKRT